MAVIYEEQDEPITMVRCLLCGEVIEKENWDLHDCDIVPWEEL